MPGIVCLAPNLQISGSSLGRGDLHGHGGSVERREGGVVREGRGWFWGGGRATCRCAEGAQAAVFSAPCLLSASCTPLCGAVGEQQCNSGGWRSRWWRSATPKTSSEIPPAGPESGSPDALTAAHYRRAAVNIPQSSPRNCIRICPMADVPNAHLSCWRHSQRAEKMGSPLLPLECGFRGLTTLSMAIFASEEVT